MCGIVGAIAQRQVSGILLEGLKRLEYRGYDSAGMAVRDQADGQIHCTRRSGKVAELEAALGQQPLQGSLGIAHTRWATHGKPEERNAHPHLADGRVAVVHNGIIENFEPLKNGLIAKGVEFASDTDTEVIAHLVHDKLNQGVEFPEAVKQTIAQLDGAYALAIIDQQQPDLIMAARMGSPLVIGIGIGENFIASDPLAMLQVTDQFIYLDEGDLAEVRLESVSVRNRAGEPVEHEVLRYEHGQDATDKGEYRHYMMKEIMEQPAVVEAVLEGRLGKEAVLEQAFGAEAKAIFDRVQSVQIIACGTSYHAGMIAKYWIEELVGIPCQIEVASEYRYRKTVVLPNSLFLTISQSGETADTLAALREAKEAGFLACLTICNVPGSSLVRESDLSLMTNAGPEIGVASTKAFTSQLVALLLTALVLGRRHGISAEQESELVSALKRLPQQLEQVLSLDSAIETLSQRFADKNHSLFLGRGAMYPVAMEGALKLKEISYIHAEAYPAGELKHGPLALVDKEMPVIVVAPNNSLLEKLKANMQEVQARGGELYVFADQAAGLDNGEGIHTLELPHVHSLVGPILYTIPLQLLSYHVAVLKGTDVDQPRNLAKSVTVE
ncbi:glutamine--fructose-6-phosphate transaminase (isomerizing) [Motiliproteus coralliicola]|uniref:Glutamine--fructose-6-phosphate aminotransferase [isomerizing] n=1 Tax=Motiliproteus coralliicola TaxID=2283196 RepID=A0A369WAJ5_9GAMM|nr:glutamine--fructose-6-phosphate transaminase (isomerizing) [Motiliproteus coralliicola]RDE18832.1 glutamine--fructose-6-phosphate transaminase (isomerizing) [Motiliproteus coralliicola]